MALNPLTKEGQEKVANYNTLQLPNNFWDRELHETYWDLLVLVHRQGALDGWYAGTREGLHRRTGCFIRLFCSKYNDATFRFNTLTEQDFIKHNIGKSVTDRSDNEFRSAIRNKTFYNKETAKSLFIPNCTFVHFTKTDLNAAEAAWHCRAISQNIADNKGDSANRCPWQIQGELMGKWIRNFTHDSATLRPDFSHITYPTHLPTMSAEKVVALLGEENNVDVAFPTMDLLNDPIYVAYVNNPTDDQIAKKARDLFKVKPLRNDVDELLFNVPNDSPTANHYINDKGEQNVPQFLEFPFLPSWAALASDSGAVFNHKSRMTALTANAAIIAPLLIYNLCKGGDTKGNILSSADAIASNKRKNV